MKKLIVLLLILTLLPVQVMADVLPDPYWDLPAPVEPEPEPIGEETDEIPSDDTEEAQTPPEADTAAETESAGQNIAPATRDYTAPVVTAAIAVAALAAAVLIYAVRTKKRREA